MIKNKKRGYTLAEIAMTLAIVGFISSITVPVLNNVVKHSKDASLFKKVYYFTIRTVDELAHDDDLYPDNDSDAQYLANTSKIKYLGKEYEGDTKFCELFATKVEVASTVDCMTHTFTTGSAPIGSFTTNDGIVWNLPVTSFALNKDIKVDINGDDAPNCEYSKIGNTVTCPNPDRFTIHVSPKGRVWVDGVKELEYIRNKAKTKSVIK